MKKKTAHKQSTQHSALQLALESQHSSPLWDLGKPPDPGGEAPEANHTSGQTSLAPMRDQPGLHNDGMPTTSASGRRPPGLAEEPVMVHTASPNDATMHGVTPGCISEMTGVSPGNTMLPAPHVHSNEAMGPSQGRMRQPWQHC
jgi:hypothetical protein